MRMWGDLPIGRVVSLTGAAPAALALTLVPLPADAPAVVIYRPRPSNNAGEVAVGALDEMKRQHSSSFQLGCPTAPASAGRVALASTRYAWSRRVWRPRPHSSARSSLIWPSGRFGVRRLVSTVARQRGREPVGCQLSATAVTRHDSRLATFQAAAILNPTRRLISSSLATPVQSFASCPGTTGRSRQTS